MANVNRRLNSIEKKLRIGRESGIHGPSVIEIGHGPSAEDEERLGPVETWITYKEQMAAQEKTDCNYQGCVPRVIVLGLNADEEYRRRSENKCQTLTED